MKKILTTLLLIAAVAAAKAQSSYIQISYDANGNRVLRIYAAGRPAPQETNNDAAQEANTLAANDTSKSSATDLLQQPGFKVYPNPSANNFNIALNESMLQNNCKLTLNDQLGEGTSEKNFDKRSNYHCYRSYGGWRLLHRN